jgi:hypothetical protein
MSYFVNFEDKVRFYKNGGSKNGHTKMRDFRTNFIFLTDGSLIYDYDRFDSMEDAIIDAVKNHGEDLDDMISMCYTQTNSHLKEYFLTQINS